MKVKSRFSYQPVQTDVNCLRMQLIITKKTAPIPKYYFSICARNFQGLETSEFILLKKPKLIVTSINFSHPSLNACNIALQVTDICVTEQTAYRLTESAFFPSFFYELMGATALLTTLMDTTFLKVA